MNEYICYTKDNVWKVGLKGQEKQAKLKGLVEVE